MSSYRQLCSWHRVRGTSTLLSASLFGTSCLVLRVPRVVHAHAGDGNLGTQSSNVSDPYTAILALAFRAKDMIFDGSYTAKHFSRYAAAQRTCRSVIGLERW